jgi:lauroyl-KDO2-lipid IV(A) myristoyltransferase
MGEDAGTAAYPPPLPRRFLLPRYWPHWLALGLLWLTGRLPRRWRFRLGAALGRQFLDRNRKRREIVRTNLSWAFPAQGPAERQRMQGEFAAWLGRSYLDFGEFWWSRRDRYQAAIAFEGVERVEAALAAGERVILLVPHSLSMDVGGLALSLRLPLMTFANAMRDPFLEWVMASRRGRFGCEVYPRERGIRTLIRAMKGGRALFFPCDEDPGRRQAEARFAPFFGIPKATLTSPVRLARLTGARLYPCTCYYDEATDRYRARVGEPLDHIPSDDPDADAAAVSAALEQAIRLAPAQYLWTQRLFQTRPDGSPPPYRMKHAPGSGHRDTP